MKAEFVGGAYETFSKNLNAQECVNWFVHVDMEGGVEKHSLRGFPSLRVWKNLNAEVEIRGVHKAREFLYVVAGNKVYRVNKNKDAVLCTGTLSTNTGIVSMADNFTQLMIVDGAAGYIVTATTLEKISDTGFVGNPTTVTHQDSYLIVSTASGNYYAFSAQSDGSSWSDLDRRDAESYSDSVDAVLSTRRDLYVFGEDTTETHYLTSTDDVFLPKPGSNQEVGIGAIHSAVSFDNTVFFLDSKFHVVRGEGREPVPASTRAIEHQISKYSRKDDAIGMSANIEGNAFYILTFPTAGATWAYNLATGTWNELMSFPRPYNKRWRGNCCAYFDGKNIVGDFENGKLYELDFEVFEDNDEPIRRTRTSKAIREDGKNVFHHQLEIFFEAGTGLITGQGSDPQAMLSYSDDGGHTWSSEIWRSAGKIGEYKRRAVWNRLGSSRQRNYRLEVTDPVKWVITGANLEAELGIT